MPQLQILEEGENFGKGVAQALGGGLQFGANLAEQGLQQKLANMYQIQQEERKRKQQYEDLLNSEEKFKQQGYPEDLAKLAAAATTGGQTEVLKQLLEMRERGPSFQESFREEIETPEGDIGLTQKERIRREEGRFAKQSDRYEDLNRKSESLDQEHMRIQRLQELNESGSLPKGMGRWNVNFRSGELRVPFAAPPEAQEFSKIVNDFLSGAKETFGARVTNFEVNRFLKRLPSLLNTDEGRRRVLRQMELINEINQVHSQSILDEFDKKGGVRKIDYDQAVRNAKKSTQDRVKQLREEYRQGEKSLTSPQTKGKVSLEEIFR